MALEAAVAQLSAAHEEEVSAARSLLLPEQPAAESAREEALASATVGAKSESRATPVSATLELRAAEMLDECERALPIGSERGESEHVLGAQQASAQQLPTCREHSKAQAEQLQPALASTQHAEHALHSMDAPNAERDDVLEASLQSRSELLPEALPPKQQSLPLLPSRALRSALLPLLLRVRDRRRLRAHSSPT